MLKIRPLLRSRMPRQHRPRYVHGAEDIHPVLRFNILRRGLFEWTKMPIAGVIHQYIDRAKAGHSRVHGRSPIAFGQSRPAAAPVNVRALRGALAMVSALLAVATTCSPAARAAFTISRPSPRLAPVTIHTLLISISRVLLEMSVGLICRTRVDQTNPILA